MKFVSARRQNQTRETRALPRRQIDRGYAIETPSYFRTPSSFRCFATWSVTFLVVSSACLAQLCSLTGRGVEGFCAVAEVEAGAGAAFCS